jgi:hypothetical protein
MAGLYESRKPKKVDLGSKGSWTSHPGRLRKELGVPQGEKLGGARIEAALDSSNPQTRRDARAAKGYAGMRRAK